MEQKIDLLLDSERRFIVAEGIQAKDMSSQLE